MFECDNYVSGLNLRVLTYLKVTSFVEDLDIFADLGRVNVFSIGQPFCFQFPLSEIEHQEQTTRFSLLEMRT